MGGFVWEEIWSLRSAFAWDMMDTIPGLKETS